MTEIDGKKYYTWDEVRAMPLGTKVRLPWADKSYFMYLERNKEGFIRTTNMQGREFMGVEMQLSLQDRFELLEDKVTGCQALEKLINGEWEKIACDHEDWTYKYVCLNQETKSFNDHQTCFVSDEISSTFLKLKKWYEYKEQQ